MEDQRTNEQASFEHSVNNTRLESQPNELLEQVKAQVLAQGRVNIHLTQKEGSENRDREAKIEADPVFKDEMMLTKHSQSNTVSVKKEQKQLAKKFP